MPAVQDCVALLLNKEHKLVKVRSIGPASSIGDTPVQVSFAWRLDRSRTSWLQDLAAKDAHSLLPTVRK